MFDFLSKWAAVGGIDIIPAKRKNRAAIKEDEIEVTLKSKNKLPKSQRANVFLFRFGAIPCMCSSQILYIYLIFNA
jgi:hypothetical protein